jgi:hypothetical protein
MRRLLLIFVTLMAAAPAGRPAEPPRDTLAAAHTRQHKLKGRVSVDFQEVELAEAIRAISLQLEDQKLGALCARFGPGASKLTRVTFTAKDQPVEVVLDRLLGSLKLGFFVIAKPGDRADGWLFLDAGSERGYPPGVTPPATAVDPEEEKTAADRLELARKLLADGKNGRAEPILRLIVKQYPATRAAVLAKELLEKKRP